VSKSKQKGTSFETSVVKFFNAAGIPVHRVALSGAFDEGDIRDASGGNEFILECKAGRMAETASRNQLNEWLVETERERFNAGAAYGFLVTKVAGKGDAQAGLWHVHMTTWTLRGKWGARMCPAGFITVSLEDFVAWWLDVNPDLLPG
jgi:hypothetical protein